MFVRNSITLTERQEAGLHILLKSGLADKALEADEKEVIARRQQLIAELPALDRALAKAIPVAERDCGDCAKDLARAQAAVITANEVLAEARAEHDSIYKRLQTRRLDIRAELIAGADTRLLVMLTLLSNLEDEVRHQLKFWPTNAPWGSDVPRYLSNEAHVIAARQELALCIAQCNTLQMSAVGYADVSQALLDMCQALEEPLAMVELNAPQFANDGAIGQPLRWNGMKQWLVDKINPPEKREPERRSTATLAPEARSRSLHTGTAERGPNRCH